MLKIQNLSCGYGENIVISHLDIAFQKGHLTVIIGPNGCGKSTLLKAIAGILPYSGEILYSGQPMQRQTDRERAKILSFLPQSRPIPEISAQKLVLHGRFPHLTYPRKYRPQDYAVAQSALQQLHISHLAQRSLPSLSGGERQKVFLAMLLAQETPVIVMDEPTTYLDISQKFEVLRIARDLSRQGKTILMVLHDLDLAMHFADTIVVLEHGHIRISGTSAEIYESRQLEQVFRVQVEQLQTAAGTRYSFLPQNTRL